MTAGRIFRSRLRRAAEGKTGDRMKSACMGMMLLASAAAAQSSGPGIEVDEDALFADTATVADSADYVGNAAAQATAADTRSLGVSGSMVSAAALSANRLYFDSPDVEATALTAGAVGNLFLDARLQRGFRAYADLEWSVAPGRAGTVAGGETDSATTFRAPEIFLDANIAHRVYFRAGKQVLQWGRGYFFNPTDLINVERKAFFRRIGSREGVYGLKAHAPFGTSVNLYGFVDAQGVGRPDSLAGAAKAEFLLGRTEFAVMVWDKGGREPVYGADLSTRALGLDVKGEAAWFREFEARTLSFTSRFPVLRPRIYEWAPRASASVGKSFRVSGIQDRLTTVAEYYYNRPGSTDRRMPFPDDLIASPPAGLSGDAVLAALAATGFYEPNSYSRHYAAVFATFNRFIRSDMTLTFNAIGNLNQRCALLSAGVSYRDINDFGLSFYVNGFAGPENTEYTFSGQAIQAQVLAEALF